MKTCHTSFVAAVQVVAQIPRKVPKTHAPKFSFPQHARRIFCPRYQCFAPFEDPRTWRSRRSTARAALTSGTSWRRKRARRPFHVNPHRLTLLDRLQSSGCLQADPIEQEIWLLGKEQGSTGPLRSTWILVSSRSRGHACAQSYHWRRPCTYQAYTSDDHFPKRYHHRPVSSYHSTTSQDLESRHSLA
jgi:hypothetical protein